MSVVTVFELYLGAFLAPKNREALKDVKKLLDWFQQPIDFDDTTAKKAAYVYEKLRRSNELIGLNDIFIAATASNLDLPVATLNKSHFSRVPKLVLM